MACDQVLICLIFPLRWGSFPIKISRNAKWIQLCSMNFNCFRSFRLYFSLKCPFPMIKSLHSGNTIYMRLLSMKDSIKIELFYFDNNFRRIAQWVLVFTKFYKHQVTRDICGREGGVEDATALLKFSITLINISKQISR